MIKTFKELGLEEEATYRQVFKAVLAETPKLEALGLTVLDWEQEAFYSASAGRLVSVVKFEIGGN